MRGPFSLDGPLLRRLALWGSKAPDSFVRVAAPLTGVVVCALAPSKRAVIVRNLRRVRGERGRLADALDAARTFANYAACVADGLGAQSGRRKDIVAIVHGQSHLREALEGGRGVVLVTAHTGGWEAAGAMLARDLGLDVLIVEQEERDRTAAAIQDEARRVNGLSVAHAGEDPFAALPLVRHLRGGGVVALQMDRVPPGMRGREVEMFGLPAVVPEGPLRLSAATGAPIVPVFAAREAHGRYRIVVRPAVRVPRATLRATGATEPIEPTGFDEAAQRLADELSAFARTHPTQWFHFDGAQSG